jgi:hypothetical protein
LSCASFYPKSKFRPLYLGLTTSLPDIGIPVESSTGQPMAEFTFKPAENRPANIGIPYASAGSS